MTLVLNAQFDLWTISTALIISYIFGSISFGLLLTKFFRLGDLRSIGSGNIGATNVLRTGNKKAAALTLFLDGGKGFLAVVVSSQIAQHDFIILYGFAVFIGHLFPIFHRFKGGKGVATFIGVILAINLLVGIIICLVWLALYLTFKKSSISALGSSLISPFLLAYFENTDAFLILSVMVIILWLRHKKNIERIFNNSEPPTSL